MSISARNTVAIVHPRLGFGGSEARVMWGAAALKDMYAVSVITTGTIDLYRLNEFYGTQLTNREVEFRSVRMPPFLSKRASLAAIRGAFFQRAVRSIAHNYSVLISAYNLCDFGIPGIHCIADFSWDEEVRRCLHSAPPGIRRFFHQSQLVRRLYLAVVDCIATRPRPNAFIDPNVIIANSKWTARVIHDKYKIATAVLYPPVNLSGDYISFAQRRDEFVCIGRISPEKRIERIIEIVKEIRRRGHRMNLRIVGALDGSGYAAKIESLARQSPEWVILEGLRQGKEKVNCLRASRYGIHACEGEAFGIAVAELIKAGCITFAPATGGQSEILNHSALLYHDLGDAADKMTAVLEHEALRGELIRHLRHQAEKFSPESFMAGLREAVNDFNQRSQSLPASLAAT